MVGTKGLYQGRPLREPGDRGAKAIRALRLGDGEAAKAVDGQRALVGDFHRELLQRTGLVKQVEQTVQMVAPAIKGKRAGPKLGEHVMMIDKPAWRRL